MALLVFLMLFLVSWAEAAPITIEWVPTPTATDYDIEQSVDFGATWQVAKSVSASVCSATKCTTNYTPPTIGLVLFRMVSLGPQGRAIRTQAGFWYNAKWSLPGQVEGTEIR